MRLSFRDAIGTVFTALASVYGIAFLLGADVPLAPSTRVVALAVLLLGLVACAASGSVEAMLKELTTPSVGLLSMMGFAAMVVAVLAIVLDSAVLVTALVAVILAMWAGTTLRHTVHVVEPRGLRAPTGTPA